MKNSIMPKQSRSGAFTLIELLTVMTIVIVLAGLIVSGAGYANREGARSRAKAEIAAMEAALESYKADNGAYPSNDATNDLDPKASVSPTTYAAASKFLYGELSGDRDFNGVAEAGTKTYFEFKDNQLQILKSGNTITVTAIADPFGFAYGYSTAYTADQNKGYNPTFDLWSTGGKTSAGTTNIANWITNW
jgi:type II secretory pathway pseudopilin PulG